jgi:hypothetical protein
MSHSNIPWMSHVVLVLIELLCKFRIRDGNQWIEIACKNPKRKKKKKKYLFQDSKDGVDSYHTYALSNLYPSE